jgi:hypothetical protein
LCLAVARYNDIEVRTRAREQAAMLADRFAHVFELYTGPKLHGNRPAGQQKIDPSDIAGHRRIRLRRKPGFTLTNWIVVLARHVERIE